MGWVTRRDLYFFRSFLKEDLSYNECGRSVDLAGTNSLRGPTQFTQRGAERRVCGWDGLDAVIHGSYDPMSDLRSE